MSHYRVLCALLSDADRYDSTVDDDDDDDDDGDGDDDDEDDHDHG